MNYTQWGREVVAGLRGVSPMLERQFEEAASEAEATITGQGSLMKGALAMKKTKHQKEHPLKWNPGNSERGRW
jgi:hypothetical protein